MEGSARAGVTRLDQLKLERRLGRGFFGEVWQATEVGGGQQTFAVKQVRLSLITENRLMDQLQREIRILDSLRHCRIVRLHFDFQDSQFMYLGMEFAKGGSLFDRLRAMGKFQAEVAARYFLETCEALDYLHHLKEKVIHRDIKPENILLDVEDHIKVADFGWANLVEADKRETFCGTLDYLPPEMILGQGHDESADMWNMGVLLYEMCTGKSPFGAQSKETTCRLILAVDLRFEPDHDADSRDLIQRLLRKKPAERLVVRDAMCHKFITQFCDRFGAAAPIEGLDARPSVQARRLKIEKERLTHDMQVLLDFKKRVEEDLFRQSEELEHFNADLQMQRKQRMEIEAKCVELAKASEERERELETKRREKLALEAEVAKLSGGSPARAPSWWGRAART